MMTSDPLNIPESDIPEDMSYQWIDREFLDDALGNGWKKVPHARHAAFLGAVFRTADGYTSLWNLTLCEKAKHGTIAERKVEMDKADQNVKDQIQKMANIIAESGFASDPDVMANIKKTSHQ